MTYLRFAAFRSIVLMMAIAAGFSAIAQEQDTTDALDTRALISELRNDVLRVSIEARVLGPEGQQLWNMNMDELTVPGRGVLLRINGENIVIQVEFTPYRQEDRNIMLLAQGSTWISGSEDNKVRYQTSLKSIPIELGTPVVYYPLGVESGDGDRPNLEIELVVSSYAQSENEANEPVETQSQDQ